ncbi:hypothetical protein [Streptomyces synnematoformans]|uniref:Uncharacterized protein n=1 Tax=Streptomyces synnematoformans TaxID=415721 RepID=A0ABN2XLG7_9ACTN
MIDIDATLRRASRGVSTWSPEAARASAALIASGPQVRIDWDESAGENWLRIVDETHVVALVSVAFPFALIQKAPGVKRPEGEIVSVVVDGLDDVELECSSETLVEVYGNFDRLRTLNSGGFSANDLWYVTV